MAFRAPEYERFQGERSRMPSWWPISRATFRRGWKVRWVRILTLLSMVPALVILMLIYAANEVLPEWREMMEQAGRNAGEGGGPDFGLQFYFVLLQVYIYVFLFSISLLLGYELISGDVRSNALESYFSRPITPWGYVFGRTIAFTGYLLLVTLVPMLLIWAVDVLTSPEGRYEDVKRIPWGLTASLSLVALTMSLFVQAVTTVTRSPIWTTLVLAILFLFSGTVGPMLFDVTENRSMLATAFWQNILVVTNGFMHYPMPTDKLAPFSLSFGLLLATMVLSGVFLLRRVKKGGAIG